MDYLIKLLTPQVISSLIQFTGLCLVFIAVKNRAYRTKKGENAALKEDIANITTIVEGIKSELNNTTEILKARLSIRNEHLISLKIAERTAIFEFYKQLWALIQFHLNVNYTRYDFNNYEQTSQVYDDSEREFYKFYLAEAQFELFSEDKEILDSILAIKKSLHAMNLEMKVSLSKIRQQFEVGKLKKEHNIKDSVEVIQSTYNDVRDIMVQVGAVNQKEYALIIGYNNKIKAFIKERLKQLAELD